MCVKLSKRINRATTITIITKQRRLYVISSMDFEFAITECIFWNINSGCFSTIMIYFKSLYTLYYSNYNVLFLKKYITYLSLVLSDLSFYIRMNNKLTSQKLSSSFANSYTPHTFSMWEIVNQILKTASHVWRYVFRKCSQPHPQPYFEGLPMICVYRICECEHFAMFIYISRDLHHKWKIPVINVKMFFLAACKLAYVLYM